MYPKAYRWVAEMEEIATSSTPTRPGTTSMAARFGINSATSVLLLIGVLTLVNYLGAEHPKRIDMTTEKTYSSRISPSKLRTN